MFSLTFLCPIEPGRVHRRMRLRSHFLMIRTIIFWCCLWGMGSDLAQAQISMAGGGASVINPQASRLAVVINTADPLSIKIGEYYAQARGLGHDQIVRLSLPVKSSLSLAEFHAFKEKLNAALSSKIQFLALAWMTPYAVECASITGALAQDWDPALCSNTCAPSAASPYLDSASRSPFQEYGFRPSMLLAARTFEQAKALIDRGVASDHSQWLRGVPPGKAYYLKTTDRLRNVRSTIFPQPGESKSPRFEVIVQQADILENVSGIMIYQTGLERVAKLDTLGFLPGALADHLTSAGGALDKDYQMSSMAWLEAGATASYGAVSEPCNHQQKFPHPIALLRHYLQGETAIEAYWKSVAWPMQGIFIGEPLAAPYLR